MIKLILGIILLALSLPFSVIGFIACGIYAGLVYGWDACGEVADWVSKA